MEAIYQLRFTMFTHFILTHTRPAAVLLCWGVLMCCPPALKAQGGGCECTNCPLYMPDFFVGNFYLTVENAANPILGQNGQGVCAVIVHFDHTALCDISISLTSPSGQTVTLVGPIGQLPFCTNMGNVGTDWFVTFLPCADPAVAPDPGFSNTWNNGQNWGMNNNYTGSYYPFTGCLQNFTGPVNGTWTLNVTDGQAQDDGNLYDYEIIFCDPSGISCFNCIADAGNLTQNDVVVCEGSQDLALNLPPTYVPPAVAPPANQYSYAYVIAGAGGVIESIQAEPDLTAFPAGTYTVCGLSYLTADAGEIPDPNGVLTVAQLRNQLNAVQTPFCGDVSVNCVGVTIKPIPDDVEETAVICAPQCYEFFNQFYCQSGTYVRTLLQNGCPYEATLNLTVNQPNLVFLNEVICGGGCSANPLFPTACSAGNYQETVQNIFGCDSTVFLNVTVLNAIANIQPPPVLSCGQASATLSGLGSSSGNGAIYTWSATNGGTILGPTNTINATIGSAGDYSLRVCRNSGGTQCCDTAMVSVIVDNSTPPAPGNIIGDSTICLNLPDTFSIAAVPGASGYAWSVPAGVAIDTGQNTVSVIVSWDTLKAGNICVAAVNACGNGPSTCFPVTVDTIPAPNQPIGLTIVCADSTVVYSTPLLPEADSFTWSVTAPATILSGQGTPQITVRWGTAPNGDVCVVANSRCGNSQPVCLSVSVGAIPPAPAASGNTVVCAGNTETYTAAPVAGADVYLWQINGGVLTAGDSTPTVQVVWNANTTTGSLCVAAANACGTSSQACVNVGISPALPLPVLAGDGFLCTGTSGVYSATAIPGATSYNWTVPAGGVIVSGQSTASIVVDWFAGPGGDVCVSAGSDCGPSPQQCFPVVVSAQPNTQAGADASICGASIGLNATNSVSGSIGVWSVIAGPGTAIFADANNPNSSVSVNPNGTYTFVWTETNSICTDTDTVQIAFNAAPEVGQIVPDCDANNQNYTISFTITGGVAPYSVPGGVVMGNGFISDPIPSGQTFSFVVTDANNCTSQPVSGAFNCNCSTFAGQMNQQALSACEGGSVNAQYLGGAVLDGNDVAAYILHSNAGVFLGTVWAQNATGAFTFQPGMVYGNTYYVSYVVGDALNGFPDPGDPCLSVSTGQPVVFYQNPVANAGIDQSACGLSQAINGNGATGVWSVSSSPVGGNIQIDNPASPAANVLASLFGAHTLTWTLTQNGCSDTDDVVLNFNDAPVAGVITETCDATNENYQVWFDITGGLAPYSINGNLLALSSYLSPAIPSGTPYVFVLTDANGCSPAPITGIYDCNCSSNAGQMSTQTLTACQGETVAAQLQGGSVLDGNDVLAYVLHTGAGNMLGTVVAQNQTGVFAFQPGMVYGQTYYVSAVVGNNTAGFPDPDDPCFSVAQGQAVVFLENPVANAGTDDAVCSLNTGLQAAASVFTGQWSVVSGAGTAVFADPAAPTSSVLVNNYGTYRFVWTETNGTCTDADTVPIRFQETPLLSNIVPACNATNTQFTLSFDVQGGQTPYTVSGLNGTFTGNTFTSSTLVENSVYVFSVADANGCASEVFTGSHECPCASSAGSMVLTPAIFCANTPANAVWNNNAVLDGNDAVQFILHDLPTNAVGTVLATSNQPVFDFGAGMQTGVTYYISAIAGNSLGSSVNLADPCLSVAPGAPVQWKPMPTAVLNGDATICSGSSTTLSFSGTGTFPLQVIYQSGIAGTISQTLANTQPFSLGVSPANTTTYTVVSVSDGTTPTCSSSLNQSVTVTVNQPVTAGMALPPTARCAGPSPLIILGALLSGNDPGGQWADVSVLPAVSGTFNASTGTFLPAANLAGTYQFRYTVPALAPCQDDATTVTVVLHPVPVADAGPDYLLNCNAMNASLGGAGTTVDATYEWFLGNTLVGTNSNLTVDTPGVYTLTATTVDGCSDTDQAVVESDAELPIAQSIETQAETCFGDNNGSIVVSNIESSHPPVLVSLNNGPFEAQTQFQLLEPGDYTIRLRDANGCEWASDTIVVSPGAALSVELGPDLELNMGDPAVVEAALTVPVSALDTLIWTPLIDTARAGLPLQAFLALESRFVSVQVIDTNGCVATDRLTVMVQKPRRVYIPNVIQPNSSLNNVLQVYGGADVASVESFMVFDRWGEKLFEATDFMPGDPSVFWSGQLNGEDLVPGVYVYYALIRFIDGEKIVYKGDVTLLR